LGDFCAKQREETDYIIKDGADDCRFGSFEKKIEGDVAKIIFLASYINRGDQPPDHHSGFS